MIALPFIVNSLLNFVIGICVAKFLGPAEYGRFALAVAIAAVIQSFLLDWLRMSAIRFYSEHDRYDHPEIRATLDVIVQAATAVALAVALGLMLSGPHLPASSNIVVFAIVVAVGNGLFDFTTALARARFLDRPYVRLVVSKNLLSIALTVGGAWYSGSAAVALVGLTLSVAGSLALNRAALADPNARPCDVKRSVALRFIGYAAPIVVANVLYQIIPAANRGLVSQLHNFAEAGQLAFAFDIGIRIFGAVGSAIDVVLFQLAVRAEKTSGVMAAREQMSRNMGIVFAILVPAAAGLWLTLPSFEHLLVPAGFRGTFAQYFTLMLPALLCFGLTNYCVGPAFQIAHNTKPLIIGGVAAIGADALAIAVLPFTRDATSFAIAQSLSGAAGLTVLVIALISMERLLPRARDMIGVLVGTAVMVAVVMPMRAMCPCAATLAIQAATGATVYALVALAFDIGWVRTSAAKLGGWSSSGWPNARMSGRRS